MEPVFVCFVDCIFKLKIPVRIRNKSRLNVSEIKLADKLLLPFPHNYRYARRSRYFSASGMHIYGVWSWQTVQKVSSSLTTPPLPLPSISPPSKSKKRLPTRNFIPLATSYLTNASLCCSIEAQRRQEDCVAQDNVGQYKALHCCIDLWNCFSSAAEAAKNI